MTNFGDACIELTVTITRQVVQSSAGPACQKCWFRCFILSVFSPVSLLRQRIWLRCAPSNRIFQKPSNPVSTETYLPLI